jgi:hypothetical protein
MKTGLCHVQECGNDIGLDILAGLLASLKFLSRLVRSKKWHFGVRISLYFCLLSNLTNGSLKLIFEGKAHPHPQGQKAAAFLLSSGLQTAIKKVKLSL